MVSSMTGMGTSEIENNDYNISVEIRTVNNRYMDISCKTPSLLMRFEHNIRELVKSKITRGKVHVTVASEVKNAEESLPIRINTQNVYAVSNLLSSLVDEAGINEQPKLDHYLKFSEIFEPVEREEADEDLWKLVADALEEALDKLVSMRRKEGGALAKDLRSRIDTIETSLGRIEEMARDNSKEAYNRMKTRVESLIGNADVDRDRLYTEIVIIADKLDITEECVRMKSHLDIFRDTLDNSSVVGKKLNFLLQEMHREVNTISSKASNFNINHIAVDLKEQIEVMREQVQNLE